MKEGIFSRSCVDVDECERDADICPLPSVCFNLRGSYECRCPLGQMSSDNGTCVADNGQETEPNCFGIYEMDTRGKGKCRCPHGFQLNNDTASPACEDIDECEYGDLACKTYGNQQKCVNTYGDFQCVDIACPKGYLQDREHNTCLHKKLDRKACIANLDKCRKEWSEPTSIAIRWITIKSNVTAPTPNNPIILYKMKGFEKGDYEFKLTIDSVNATDGGIPLDRLRDLRLGSKPDVRSASSSDLNEVNKGDHEGVLYLINPLTGPLKAKLTIDVTHAKHSKLNVLHRSIVHLFVSKYDGEKFDVQ
jgi:hypothetical protein